MDGLNKVILIGRIEDIEVKKTPLGDLMTILKICTTRHAFNRKTNKKHTHTQKHRIIVHKKLAEMICDTATEGAHVFIEGEIYNKQFTDRSGKEQSVPEIVATSVQMLDSSYRNNTVH